MVVYKFSSIAFVMYQQLIRGKFRSEGWEMRRNAACQCTSLFTETIGNESTSVLKMKKAQITLYCSYRKGWYSIQVKWPKQSPFLHSAQTRWQWQLEHGDVWCDPCTTQRACWLLWSSWKFLQWQLGSNTVLTCAEQAPSFLFRVFV
jgi:hypothetical protein